MPAGLLATLTGILWKKRVRNGGWVSCPPVSTTGVNIKGNVRNCLPLEYNNEEGGPQMQRIVVLNFKSYRSNSL